MSSIFVATWNVAGRSPPTNLSIDDWLHASPPADIYVLGYDLFLLTFFKANIRPVWIGLFELTTDISTCKTV
jgi:hypothetical protein